MLRALAPAAVMMALLAGSSVAQVTPRMIEIDKLTCADILATKGEARHRLLVYLNGYVNGMRGQRVWNEQMEGERIERAEMQCKAAPTRTALDVLTTVWPR